MRIAILGGSFNPVHGEHIRLAEGAIKELDLDKLYIMPTFLAPHKTETPASAEDRLAMLNLAFSGMEKVEVSDYEIKKGGKSYTYITAEEFRRRFPDDEIFFLMGEDMLADFKTWKEPSRIVKAVKIAVFGRDNFTADFFEEEKLFNERFGASFIKLPITGKDFSSTKIRIYASFGLPISGETTSPVCDYIIKKGLYPADIYTEYVKKNLPEKRLIHTANVVVCALKKAHELGLDSEKVRIAATLHDCAKYKKAEDYEELSLPEMPNPVVHAYLGAFVAEKELGITDSEIVDAIRYHTSGRANMSLLEKLVFVADMVEEGRDYEGVDKLRKLYEKDFELCFTTCLKEEMLHLKNKGTPIFYRTEEAYNYYVK